jgi:hypothetical protein
VIEMRNSLRMRTSTALLLAVAPLVGVACSDDSDPVMSVPDSTVSPSTEVPSDSTAPEETLPADVSASGVLLAATLIASGNVDDAVASGLVTPAEVDEARAAIENGTLDRWVALAEGR